MTGEPLGHEYDLDYTDWGPLSGNLRPEFEWFRVRNDELKRIVPEDDYYQQPLTIPPNNVLLVPPPSHLSSLEKEQLLVFQARYVLPEILSQDPITGEFNGPIPGTTNNLAAAILRLTFYEELSLDPGVLEFIVMATHLNSFSKTLQELNILVMVVKTDQRGISERVDLVILPVLTAGDSVFFENWKTFYLL